MWISKRARAAWLVVLLGSWFAPGGLSAKDFVLARDAPALTNELLWAYSTNASGLQVHHPRVPKPEFHSRCFALARLTLLFHRHARFNPDAPAPTPKEAGDILRRVRSRSPRATRPCASSSKTIEVPGFAGFHDFSAACPEQVRSVCGGAWRKYLQRGHWRMVFPFTGRQQERTARKLTLRLARQELVALHILKFPALTINHAFLAYQRVEKDGRLEAILAYDPNQPREPLSLRWNPELKRFSMAPNSYFAGGLIDVSPVYSSWWN